MTNEVSKKQFLKRYLEKEDESSRKRKKKSKLVKPSANVSCLKIVNKDIDLKSMNFGDKVDDDDEDEMPIVAEVIDERPVEVKLKELYDSSRWKKFNSCETFQLNSHDPQKATSHETKNKRHDSDEDYSPLRGQKCTINAKRHDSESDISPPRSQNHNTSKCNSDSDLSPARSHKQITSSFQNRKQTKKKHNSDSDLSPPRSHKVSSTTRSSRSDLPDPPKKVLHDKKIHSNRHSYDDDLSPLREPKKNSNSNVSSPQRYRHKKNRHDSDDDLSPPRSHGVSSVKGKNKLDKTLSGLKAGLQNSKSLQEEVQDLRNRERFQLNMLEDEISGRNADTIIRDRNTGKKRDLSKEQESKKEEDKKNKEYLQKYEKWGKGTENRDEHLEKIKDEIHEMSKPLARYEDDADLDERLKSIIHDDDPMSAYMKKKKQKESGTPNYPVYTGPIGPPNRFGIKPGYRWDGVNRSNGFEAKYFEKINHTKAVKDEAYLWSVQDM